MSEYLHVEKPFLDQLATLGWAVIDQGHGHLHRLHGHRRRLDHTDAFWNEVDKVIPTYGERKEWLRVNGAGLDV